MLNRRAAGTLADAYNFAAFLSTKRTVGIEIRRAQL
jgi:hypothetical protein